MSEFIIESDELLIRPDPECGDCGGYGKVSAGTVPYGSTNVSLPDEYCDCVLTQLPEEFEGDIELDLSAAPRVETEPDFDVLIAEELEWTDACEAAERQYDAESSKLSEAPL